MARTRDEQAKQRILCATRDLIAQRGPAQATITEIAAVAGVGRGTIYRWWPTRSAVVIEALIEMTDSAMPYRSTGDAEADIRRQMRAMVRAFAGSSGALIREILAEAQADPELAETFRATFFDHRRDQARAFFTGAIEQNLLEPVTDLDSLIYALYAPLWLALLVGHEPLTARTADRAFDAVFNAPLLVASPAEVPEP